MKGAAEHRNVIQLKGQKPKRSRGWAEAQAHMRELLGSIPRYTHSVEVLSGLQFHNRPLEPSSLKYNKRWPGNYSRAFPKKRLVMEYVLAQGGELTF